MQRIGTRLDALARLGDFETQAKYADWRAGQDASDRIFAVLRTAFPTTPLRKTLSACGKHHVISAAKPGGPNFETDLAAFAARFAADALTDADSIVVAKLSDDDFRVIGIPKREYLLALDRILSYF